MDLPQYISKLKTNSTFRLAPESWQLELLCSSHIHVVVVFSSYIYSIYFNFSATSITFLVPSYTFLALYVCLHSICHVGARGGYWFFNLTFLLWQKNKVKGKERIGQCHSIMSTSLEVNASYTLHNILLTDEEEFFNYCLMSTASFDELCHILKEREIFYMCVYI